MLFASYSRYTQFFYGQLIGPGHLAALHHRRFRRLVDIGIDHGRFPGDSIHGNDLLARNSHLACSSQTRRRSQNFITASARQVSRRLQLGHSATNRIFSAHKKIKKSVFLQ